MWGFFFYQPDPETLSLSLSHLCQIMEAWCYGNQGRPGEERAVAVF